MPPRRLRGCRARRTFSSFFKPFITTITRRIVIIRWTYYGTFRNLPVNNAQINFTRNDMSSTDEIKCLKSNKTMCYVANNEINDGERELLTEYINFLTEIIVIDTTG